MNDPLRLKKTWISSAHQGFVSSGIHQNTIAAYLLAAKKGADMIETDARTTSDGVFIVNHDPTVKGFDEDGNLVEYEISSTKFEKIRQLHLIKNGGDDSRVPTLIETLDLAYFTGMAINIDLKEGLLHAADIARLVTEHGMRGRTIYATNGAGTEAIRAILAIDPDAKFIDTKANFTAEKLCEITDRGARCFVYTGDFFDGNISEIRKSGCMLAAISLSEKNAADAFRHHPDMAEYPHTSDFEAIDKMILSNVKYF